MEFTTRDEEVHPAEDEFALDVRIVQAIHEDYDDSAIRRDSTSVSS